MIDAYLEKLENAIEPEIEDALYGEWMDFIEGRFKGELFLPTRKEKLTTRIEWPSLSVKEFFKDKEKMALQQLKTCYDALDSGNGAVMNIRANYGCGIMATLFGCELFMMEDPNTLPSSVPLPGGTDDVRKILDKGMPELDSGLGAKVLETDAYYTSLIKDYPKLSRYVHIYHPDLQGPLDLCELIWGTEMFVGLYEEAQLAKDFLTLITDTYIAFVRKWMDVVPDRGPCTAHWGYLIKGKIMLRSDSAMNLSPEMFREFSSPYDARIFEAFGGGAIHFCGRGDHYIGEACAIPGLNAINMTQPSYNDTEKIYRSTVDKGIKLLGLEIGEAKRAVGRGRSLKSNAHSRGG